MAGKFYPTVRMTIPDEKPYRLIDLLKLFFRESEHNLKVQLAKAFLETVREEMPKGWPSDRWPELLLKVMAERYPEAEKLLKEYKETLIWTKSKSEIPGILSKRCRELGLVEEGQKKAKGRDVDLFTIYKGAYSVITKVLREAGLIKKVNGYYQLSDEFERILEGIAEFWRYWRKGKAE